MSGKTGIEWTDATWNPVVGCSIVSPGCKNCYAMRQANFRLDGNPKTPHYAGTTERVNGKPVWTGKVTAAPERVLLEPLRWKKPRMIFVNSMGDLFHEDCPYELIDRVFAVMALAPQHIFQVLTKRAKRMRDYMMELKNEPLCRMALAIPHPEPRFGQMAFPLSNVWLGVSAEDQARADKRIPLLLDTPAAVRFVSAEPLLGPIALHKLRYDPGWMDAIAGYDQGGAGYGSVERRRLDWIIAGGESGAGARPMHPDWPRGLRDQCAAAGVPFFFKQWGEHLHRSMLGGFHKDVDGFHRVGKARAGRLLDGVTHDGMPEIRT